MAAKGRPSGFTQQVAADICAQIADGESLRAICRKDKMPSMATVFRWLAEKDKESFREQYARAREQQADAYADDIVAIADSIGDPNDKRVRIDARKWVASKLRPKVYGEKLDIDARAAVTVTLPGPLVGV